MMSGGIVHNDVVDYHYFGNYSYIENSSNSTMDHLDLTCKCLIYLSECLFGLYCSHKRKNILATSLRKKLVGLGSLTDEPTSPAAPHGQYVARKAIPTRNKYNCQYQCQTSIFTEFDSESPLSAISHKISYVARWP